MTRRNKNPVLNADAPSWFNLADYEYVHSLDALGWYRALAIREEYAEFFDWSARREFGLDQQPFWDEFRQETSPKNLTGEPPDLLEPQAERVAALEEIPANIFTDPEKAHAFAYSELGVADKKAISIDLTAPDTLLLASFRSWLRGVRDEHPLSLKRRGVSGRSPNIEVTNDHFDSWAEHQILACFDLDFWSKIFGHKRLPHRVICNLLKPDLPPETDPLEWGRYAREVSIEAFNCIGMLAHQASQPGVK